MKKNQYQEAFPTLGGGNQGGEQEEISYGVQLPLPKQVGSHQDQERSNQGKYSERPRYEKQYGKNRDHRGDQGGRRDNKKYDDRRPYDNRKQYDDKKDYDRDYKERDNRDQRDYYDTEKEHRKIAPKQELYTGGPVKVLMVAEKPSIAKSIVEALGGNNFRTFSGHSKYVKIFEFKGMFKQKEATFKITAVTGHVKTTDFPKEYQNWEQIKPRELFDAKTEKKEANPKSRIVKHLQAEARGCTYLCLWLDNDREGENICFEVKDICEPYMKKAKFEQIFRAKFSSLVKQDLREAYNRLSEPPNENESISVDARQIIDLKIGVAFSRFQTLYFQKEFPDIMRESLITYGPCQTPTLGFCVTRNDEIKNFKPQNYWTINVLVQSKAKKDSTARELTADWVGDRTFDEQEARKIQRFVEQQAPQAECLDIKNSEGTNPRPEALNTVKLLKTASSTFGIGPHRAMQLAEKLYLAGYLTYPRTESTHYPTNFNFKEIINCLSKDGSKESKVGPYATKLKDGYNQPRSGKDMGDHPPITPTSSYPHNLDSEQLKIWTYVAQHFLGSIGEDAKFQKTVIAFQIGDEKFKAHGISKVQPGFSEVMPWMKQGETLIPAGFEEKQNYKVMSCQVQNKKTQPPENLSESELLGLMEKNGIGTDASMATHINNICERKYVVIKGGRQLVPTDLGQSLVQAYRKIDPELVAPDLRSNIEKNVDAIAKGQSTFEEVLTSTLAVFKEKFRNFEENASQLNSIFSKNVVEKKKVKDEKAKKKEEENKKKGIKPTEKKSKYNEESSIHIDKRTENQYTVNRYQESTLFDTLVKAKISKNKKGSVTEETNTVEKSPEKKKSDQQQESTQEQKKKQQLKKYETQTEEDTERDVKVKEGNKGPQKKTNNFSDDQSPNDDHQYQAKPYNKGYKDDRDYSNDDGYNNNNRSDSSYQNDQYADKLSDGYSYGNDRYSEDSYRSRSYSRDYEEDRYSDRSYSKDRNYKDRDYQIQYVRKDDQRSRSNSSDDNYKKGGYQKKNYQSGGRGRGKQEYEYQYVKKDVNQVQQQQNFGGGQKKSYENKAEFNSELKTHIDQESNQQGGNYNYQNQGYRQQRGRGRGGKPYQRNYRDNNQQQQDFQGDQGKKQSFDQVQNQNEQQQNEDQSQNQPQQNNQGQNQYQNKGQQQYDNQGQQNYQNRGYNNRGGYNKYGKNKNYYKNYQNYDNQQGNYDYNQNQQGQNFDYQQQQQFDPNFQMDQQQFNQQPIDQNQPQQQQQPQQNVPQEQEQMQQQQQQEQQFIPQQEIYQPQEGDQQIPQDNNQFIPQDQNFQQGQDNQNFQNFNQNQYYPYNQKKNRNRQNYQNQYQQPYNQDFQNFNPVMYDQNQFQQYQGPPGMEGQANMQMFDQNFPPQDQQFDPNQNYYQQQPFYDQGNQYRNNRGGYQKRNKQQFNNYNR